MLVRIHQHQQASLCPLFAIGQRPGSRWLQPPPSAPDFRSVHRGRGDDEREIKPNHSVAWHAVSGNRGLSWGLIESVAEDGTVTILAGPHRHRVRKHPDDIARHQSGREKFLKVYPDDDLGGL